MGSDQYGLFGRTAKVGAMVDPGVGDGPGQAIKQAGRRFADVMAGVENTVEKEAALRDMTALKRWQIETEEALKAKELDLEDFTKGRSADDMAKEMDGFLSKVKLPEFRGGDTRKAAELWWMGERANAGLRVKKMGQAKVLADYRDAAGAEVEFYQKTGQFGRAAEAIREQAGILYTSEEAANKLVDNEFEGAKVAYQRLLSEDAFTARDRANEAGLLGVFAGRPDLMAKFDAMDEGEQRKEEARGLSAVLDGELNGEFLSDEEVREASRGRVRGVRLSADVGMRLLARRAVERERFVKLTEEGRKEAMKTHFDAGEWSKCHEALQAFGTLVDAGEADEVAVAGARAGVEELLLSSQLTEVQRKEFQDRVKKLVSGDETEKAVTRLKRLADDKVDDLWKQELLVPGLRLKMPDPEGGLDAAGNDKLVDNYKVVKLYRNARYELETRFDRWARLHPEASPDEVDEALEGMRAEVADRYSRVDFKSGVLPVVPKEERTVVPGVDDLQRLLDEYDARGERGRPGDDGLPDAAALSRLSEDEAGALAVRMAQGKPLVEVDKMVDDVMQRRAEGLAGFTDRGVKTGTGLARFATGGLAKYADVFEEAGRRFGVDPKLLLAIAKHETGNGTSKAFLRKNNAMGVSPNGGGPRAFGSVKESVDYMAERLKRFYLDEGRTTVAQIGAKYAPVGAKNDPKGQNSHWVKGVSRYLREMQEA